MALKFDMVRLAAALLVGVAAWGVVAPESRAQPIEWEHIGGEASVNGLAFDEADTLWAIGPAGRGLRHMPPGTETWAEISDAEGNLILFTDAGSIIIESGGLARSTDRGRTFESVGQPAGGGLYRVRGGPLAGRLFAGVRSGDVDNGAAFSTDDGVTWTHAPVGNPDGFGGDAQAFLAVEEGPHAGRVVAGCYNGVAYTDDGGQTWELSSLWQPFNYAVFSLVRLPPGSGHGPGGRRLLAGVDAGCCPERIYASDDDGATWEPLAALGSNSERVLLSYAGPTAAGPQTVYAVTAYSDVWRSGDGGLTWEELGNVYPEAVTFVKDAVMGPDGRLYVAQRQAGSGQPTDGLYRTVAPVVVASESGAPEQRGATLAVYPNPSAGLAAVTLTLGEAAEVRVAVFDVLGREVAAVHEGQLAAGEHHWAFDGSDLPAGVYVVRATGPGLSVTQPVTVL